MGFIIIMYIYLIALDLPSSQIPDCGNTDLTSFWEDMAEMYRRISNPVHRIVNTLRTKLEALNLPSIPLEEI
jgi:hypothetical protein